MYYKRSTGAVFVRKSVDTPDWVQWTHHSEGKTHCDECMSGKQEKSMHGAITL